jgi:hypothetical protein
MIVSNRDEPLQILWARFDYVASPQFQKVLKSEQNEKTVEKVDVTYLRPTDFSPMK